MPNYVFNKLKAGSDVRNLDIFTDENLDFNKIIPMPKELQTSYFSTDNRLGLMLLWKESRDMVKKGKDATKNALRMSLIDEAYQSINPFYKDISDDISDWEDRLSGMSSEREAEVLEAGKISLNNFERYGACSWYEWSCNNWNTKWNASDTMIDGTDTIYFTTAWSMPENIIIELSRRLQGIEVEISWSDEGTAENIGKATYKNGQFIKGGFLKPFSEEWKKVVQELGGCLYYHDGDEPDVE